MSKSELYKLMVNKTSCKVLLYEEKVTLPMYCQTISYLQKTKNRKLWSLKYLTQKKKYKRKFLE